MIFFDTETCGLHGIAVLIQWAEDDGEIHLHDVWSSPIYETLDLIHKLTNSDICGFNLAFDWFHIVKLYNILIKYKGEAHYPEDDIDGILAVEREAIHGVVLKPKSAVDLMLIAHSTRYQMTKERKDIRIKKIPNILAVVLCDYLNEQLKLDPILFERSKKTEHWSVVEHKSYEGVVDYDFKDIKLSFAPSASLKAITRDITKGNPINFQDIACQITPEESGWAPFNKNTHGWRNCLWAHRELWQYNELARQYAEDDVTNTRDLYYHLDKPEPDVNSELTIMVANVRWKGYSVDIEAIRELKNEAEVLSNEYPTAPSDVKKYLYLDLSPAEKDMIDNKTNKKVLLELEKWKIICPLCQGVGCENCQKRKGFELGEVEHPVAIKAKKVGQARTAQKLANTFSKILEAKRFHPSFRVMGALSDRMSGSDGLNAQGIDRKKEVRSAFTLNDEEDYVLCGGDFAAFEVCIAEAVFNDEKLRHDLTNVVDCLLCKTTGKCYHCGKKQECKKCYGLGCDSCWVTEICPKCKGKDVCDGCDGEGKAVMKIHALFGQELYPDMDYEEIIASKGLERDFYNQAKSGVFSQMYGGDENTLADRLDVDLLTATEATENWKKRYPGIGRFMDSIHDDYCSMKQPGGIGSKVIWDTPKETVVSLFNHPRYFTIENQICKFLYDLANNPPKEWTGFKTKVIRRDRVQTAGGAVMSALFASAFSIQAKNMRAAANHLIQSTGAGATKQLQLAIWNIQPQGVNPWIVRPMNVHDEIMVVVHKNYVSKLTEVVENVVESLKPTIPLIKMDWSNNISNWGEK